MNARSLPEWIAANPDAKIPARVRLRVFEKFNGKCGCCGRKIMVGEKWDCDHIIALANAGEHREANLQPIIIAHHKSKTALDIAVKSKTYRRRAKHLGIARHSSFATNKTGAFKRKMDGSIVRRELTGAKRRQETER